MMKHLRGKHPEVFQSKHGKQTEEKTTPFKVQQQQIVLRYAEDTNFYDICHPRAKQLTQAIAEMMCYDLQPFSIVSDAGFVKFSGIAEPRYKIPTEKYFRETAIPLLYETLCDKMGHILDKQQFISVSANVWHSNANDSYMSFTVHFMTTQFEWIHLCLQTFPFNESFSSHKTIMTQFDQCTQTWNLEHKIHLIVHDSRLNVNAAFGDSEYRQVPCLIHTIQQVVNNTCSTQKVIVTLISACRKLIGSFCHSPIAAQALKDEQKRLAHPEIQLVKDQPERWDSTYIMMVQLNTCKEAIVNVCGKLNISVELDQKQWDLMGKIINVLQTFDEAVKIATCDSATIGLVLPVIRTLKKALEPNDNDSCIMEMKRIMSRDLMQRYPPDTEWIPHYSVAMLLDPRFKKALFEADDARNSAVSHLIDEVDEVLQKKETNKTFCLKETRQVQNVAVVNNALKNEQPNFSTFMAQLLGNTVPTATLEVPILTRHTAEKVVKDYLSEPQIPFTPENDISFKSFWIPYIENHASASALGVIARKFLSAPPSSSVSLEKMFTNSSALRTAHLCHLYPNEIDIMISLNQNLRLINDKLLS